MQLSTKRACPGLAGIIHHKLVATDSISFGVDADINSLKTLSEIDKLAILISDLFANKLEV